MRNNTFGNHPAAQNLDDILTKLGDPRTSRKVGRTLARYSEMFHELSFRNLPHIGGFLLMLLKHSKEQVMRDLICPHIIKTHMCCVMTARYRDWYRAQKSRRF